MWKYLFVIQNTALCLSVGFILGREWYPAKKRKKLSLPSGLSYNSIFTDERR